MASYHRVILTAFAVFGATCALANDKQDFESCDGRVHPGKQDDGMRGEAGRRSFEYPLYSPDANRIAACTRALASPRLLPQQTLRKAHLLRARAAAHLGQGKFDAGLADLDAAEGATAALAQEPFFQRSMGLSLTMLRAMAYAQSDRTAEAVPLVQQAMAARPYALQVQKVGAELLEALRPIDGTSPSPWGPVVRLEPMARWNAVGSEAALGNFAQVLAIAGQTSAPWPTEPLKPFSIAARAADGNQFLNALVASLHQSYAHAATGDGAAARQRLAEVREKAKQLVPAGPSEGAQINASSQSDLISKFIDSRARQVELRIAINEGRTSDVIAGLVTAPLPRDAATRDIMIALKAALPEKDVALVPGSDAYTSEIAATRKAGLNGLARQVLLAPETPRSVIDYDRARPNILSALVGGGFVAGYVPAGRD